MKRTLIHLTTGSRGGFSGGPSPPNGSGPHVVKEFTRRLR